MIKDDSLWKGILENVFDDFLFFFFKDADKLFDMENGFQLLDKEFEIGRKKKVNQRAANLYKIF